jgi:hypothetical protein
MLSHRALYKHGLGMKNMIFLDRIFCTELFYELYQRIGISME